MADGWTYAQSMNAVPMQAQRLLILRSKQARYAWLSNRLTIRQTSSGAMPNE